MTQNISTLINEILFEIRQNYKNSQDLSLINKQSIYNSDFMKRLVHEIHNKYDDILKVSYQLIKEDRLEFFKKSISSFINSLRNVNSSTEIIDLIAKQFNIILKEEDLYLEKSKLDKLIKASFNDNINFVIYSFFEGRKASFRYCYENNPAYDKYSNSFILADLLITEELSKYSSPIEDVSNDYCYLIECYRIKDLDILKIDSQFSKYGLLSIENGIELLSSTPARIYDERLNLTFFLNGIENDLLAYLILLYQNHEMTLSVKPSAITLKKGRYELTPLLEHLERGAYFDISNFNAPILTKLYSSDYENSLWINIESTDLTFEEIIDDFDISGDSIVTQVVHSQYTMEDNKLFITHLDHEFIFYTLDQYEKRKTNIKQKGEAKKRIKTFKIDNCKIQVNETENILYEVLLLKFKQIDLLKEYFYRTGL